VTKVTPPARCTNACHVRSVWSDAVNYRMADMGGYLRADLLQRETAAESAQFLEILKEAALKHPSRRVLICVHSPRAIFKVEKYGASAFLQDLAAEPAGRVALVAKHFEVRLTQQYLEVLARLKKARLRSFANETAAVRWLSESREGEALDELVGRPLR
jgi:hypothetical protein